MTGGVVVRTMRTVLRASAADVALCALASKANSERAEQAIAMAAESARLSLAKTVISLRPTVARSSSGAVYRRGGADTQSFLEEPRRLRVLPFVPVLWRHRLLARCGDRQ